MTVLERAIKVTLAAMLAILSAQLLGLSSAGSAGIIAILSVLDTRKSTLEMASRRFISMVLAFIIAWLSFSLLGYHLYALAIYLLSYTLLAYSFKLAAGVAPSTVLVMHLLAQHSVAYSLILNEVALFVIGVGWALLLNLYMPSKEKDIEAYHSKVERQLKEILYRFETFLIKGDGTNDARLIKELDQILQKALELVYRDRHNRLFSQTDYQVHYFDMRKQQNQILAQMARTIATCQLEIDESRMLAELFRQTAQQLSQSNPALSLIDDIDQTLAHYRQRQLPKTRSEFEARAVLFQLLQDLKRFIQLKVEFYNRYRSLED